MEVDILPLEGANATLCRKRKENVGFCALMLVLFYDCGCCYCIIIINININIIITLFNYWPGERIQPLRVVAALPEDGEEVGFPYPHGG